MKIFSHLVPARIRLRFSKSTLFVSIIGQKHFSVWRSWTNPWLRLGRSRNGNLRLVRRSCSKLRNFRRITSLRSPSPRLNAYLLVPIILLGVFSSIFVIFDVFMVLEEGRATFIPPRSQGAKTGDCTGYVEGCPFFFERISPHAHEHVRQKSTQF